MNPEGRGVVTTLKAEKPSETRFSDRPFPPIAPKGNDEAPLR
jgi:hypothetical protein